MNGVDNSEQIAQAWAAAGALNQASQSNTNADQYSTSTSNNIGAPIPGQQFQQQMPSTSQPPPLPPFNEAAIPQRRRLPSYVSEPPSTLLALSMMAQEEAAAQNAELGASSTFTPAAASTSATAAQQNNIELDSDMTLREMAWMHSPPQNASSTSAANKGTTPVFGRSHLKQEAGDLAGAELRQRRRPPPIRLNSAPRSLSPSRTLKTGSVRSAGTANGNPKTRVKNIQGLVRRRDADVLFSGSKSDSDDDGDSDDVDKVAKGTGPIGTTGGVKGAGSPRSDQAGKVGSEFEIDVPLGKPKRPFYKRRKFWVFSLMLTWCLTFVTVGVCLLVFKPYDDTTKLQAWRLCFFCAGLPVIWYIGDFVTHMIVWAVERSMFTVKNALYFAYAVRKPLRNVIRALLTLGWWPLMMTIEYTGQQSDAALKAYDIILKIWACITLFMVANLIKVLLGKILALKFNKESHLNKMYTTLKKEQWLHCLLVPRQSYTEAGMLERGQSSGLVGQFGLPLLSSSKGRRSTARLFSKFRMSRSASDGDALIEGEDDTTTTAAPGLYTSYSVGGVGGGTGGGFDDEEEEDKDTAGGDDQMMQTRSSSGFGDKFKFWRKSSAPLDIITEESTSHVELTKGGGTAAGKKSATSTAMSIRSPTAGGGSRDRKYVSITIDTVIPASPRAGGTGSTSAQQQPPLPPLRVDNPGGASSSSPTTAARIGSPNPLERSSAGGPASPLPPRAAIDAAYAAQKIRRSQTTVPAAAANTVTSPSKQQKFRRHASLRSNNTATDSMVSANNTATTLQQHNKDIAVGTMPDFGTGPLRRDEVMTRLARLERYIRKTNLEVTFRDALNNVEKSEVTNDTEAKRVGYFLFWNVKSNFEDSPISKEDLEEFIPSDDVDDAYDMLDDDGDGKVTRDDCVAAVQNIYQQRANLAASLKDSRSIASSLEVMIGVIVHLLFVMIYFYILFAVTFNQIWAFVSTVVLGLSFIFGQYIRMIFENTMFLFNSHPFDIGDMLFVDNDFLTVDEIQINFTICINSSKQRIWVPNQRLVNNPFINLTTSGNRTENIIILVDMDTPPHVLDDILAAMEALKDEMPQEYAAVGGSFRDAAVPMKMTLKLFYDFTHTGTNLARCARARSRMYICVAAAMQKAGVAYTWPAMRTLNLPASSSSRSGETAASAAAGVVAAAADPNTASIVGVL